MLPAPADFVFAHAFAPIAEVNLSKVLVDGVPDPSALHGCIGTFEAQFVLGR